MTPEQEERVVSALERIADALGGGRTGARGTGQDAGGGATARMEAVANAKIGAFADAMIEEISKPGGTTKERWENARDAVK